MRARPGLDPNPKPNPIPHQVYGPSSRRYLFLKQAMMERRLVLFLDGMDEVPTLTYP